MFGFLRSNSNATSILEPSYWVVSKFLGLVLVGTGATKAYAAILAWKVASDDTNALSTALGFFEMAFGLWMFLGLHPRVTRVLAVLFFAALLNVAIYMGVSGIKTCGCLGRITLSPWWAVAFDVFALTLLLICKSNASEPIDLAYYRQRRRGFSLAVLFLFAVFAAGIGSSKLGPSFGIGNSPGKDARKALDILCEGIDKNTAYDTVKFDLISTCKDPSVTQEKTEEIKFGDTIVTRYVSPESSMRFQFACDAHQLRRTCISAGFAPAGEVVIRSQNRAMQYDPTSKQTWIRPDHEIGFDPLDPRCFGLNPPARSLTGWLRELRNVEVTTSKQDGDELFSITALDRKGVKVSGDFSSRYNYLPQRICYLFDDNSISSCATMIYQRDSSDSFWFLKEGTRYHFAKGKTQTPTNGGFLLAFIHTIPNAPQVNTVLAKDTFAPLLPKGTTVSDRIENSAHKLSADTEGK